MGGRCYVGELLKRSHVLRMAPKLIIPDKCTEWCPAKGAEFFFVYLLEQRALVELDCTFKIAAQLLLTGVQHFDLEHGARFARHHQEMQPAPRRFQFLESGVVHDLIELIRDESVDISVAGIDARLDIL